jgi:hypothetical protein
MWIVAFNICPLSWVRNMCSNQYLETFLSLVTKDAFVVVEALVKNQCKGKTLQLFPSTFHNHFFSPCSCKFMICVCFSKSWRSFDSKTIAKLLLWWEEILIFFHFKMFSKKIHVIHPCRKEYMTEKNTLWKPLCEAKLLWNIIFFFFGYFLKNGFG